MFEYHQELVPQTMIAEVCNRAAEDGWELFGLLGAMAVASSSRLEVQPQPIVSATLVFRRQKEEANTELVGVNGKCHASDPS